MRRRYPTLNHQVKNKLQPHGCYLRGKLEKCNQTINKQLPTYTECSAIFNFTISSKWELSYRTYFEMKNLSKYFATWGNAFFSHPQSYTAFYVFLLRDDRSLNEQSFSLFKKRNFYTFQKYFSIFCPSLLSHMYLTDRAKWILYRWSVYENQYILSRFLMRSNSSSNCVALPGLLRYTVSGLAPQSFIIAASYTCCPTFYQSSLFKVRVF